MNRKQRMQNRATAEWLERNRHTCPECGQRGKHWAQPPQSLDAVLNGLAYVAGFWTCDKFYGPDGRRLAAA